jgi:hypothetical protein
MGIMMAALLTFVFISSTEADAQSRRQIERERQRIEREQRRYERQRQGRMGRATERQINNSTFNTGYQQGLLAGQYDRRKRKYNQSNVYRGTGSAPNSGDPSNMDYIYRQAYLQGYEDGFHGRYSNY